MFSSLHSSDIDSTDDPFCNFLGVLLKVSIFLKVSLINTAALFKVFVRFEISNDIN